MGEREHFQSRRKDFCSCGGITCYNHGENTLVVTGKSLFDTKKGETLFSFGYTALYSLGSSLAH